MKNFIMLIAIYTFIIYPNLISLAQADNPYRKGLHCYEILDISCAIKELTYAIEKSNLSDEEKNNAYLHIGFSYIILNDKEKAKVNFIKAFEINPKLEIDSLNQGPKIKDLFEEAKKEFFESDNTAPRITHYPRNINEKLPSSVKIEILAHVTDDRFVKNVILYYKNAEELTYNFKEMILVGKDQYKGVIPSFIVTKSGVEYYIEAKDAKGNTTLSASNSNPYYISIAENKHWYEKWWVWGLGAIIIGGSIGATISLLGNNSNNSSSERVTKIDGEIRF